MLTIVYINWSVVLHAEYGPVMLRRVQCIQAAGSVFYTHITTWRRVYSSLHHSLTLRHARLTTSCHGDGLELRHARPLDCVDVLRAGHEALLNHGGELGRLNDDEVMTTCYIARCDMRACPLFVIRSGVSRRYRPVIGPSYSGSNAAGPLTNRSAHIRHSLPETTTRRRQR